jgi:hypothetical protein
MSISLLLLVSFNPLHSQLESVLFIDTEFGSLRSTPQWIRQPEPRDAWLFEFKCVH